eukprot:gnl/MRDRNA2_/MRDRNA2_98725_c0_seq1.p1 gnl/MRDRNA2_/MRDRNA2_98725_c0~~gnl/MRDRNA2_/MRDRNA2_98725_c0_seq1.p1  ORF type:complete len:601 (+),score=156.07 gnl/MRDRNA2_/MRDRNA2_98725_c0_seq1:117-1919(+)
MADVAQTPKVGGQDKITPFAKEHELEIAEMETRLRQMVLELLKPTIHKTSRLTFELETLSEKVGQHGAQLEEMLELQQKVSQQMEMIDIFRDEMAKRGADMRAFEAKCIEEQQVVRRELENFRHSFEQKKSVLAQLTRNVDRAMSEVTMLQEELDKASKDLSDRLDGQTKTQTEENQRVHIRIDQLEKAHYQLHDELWGEDTGLKKIEKDLGATNRSVRNILEEIEGLKKHKDILDALASRQDNCEESLKSTQDICERLRQAVERVADETKDQLRDASNLMAAHSASLLKEVRGSFKEELGHSQRLRTDVMTFMRDTQAAIVELRRNLETTSSQTEAVAKEVRIDLEEVNSKRKIDKLSLEAELKAFRQRIGGAFEHSEALLRGLEHIAGVVSVALQSERISAALDFQDFTDRKKESLVICRNDNKSTDELFSQTTKDQSGRKGSKFQGMQLEVDLTQLTKCEYNPGTIGYQGNVYDRQDIMMIREQLIHKAQEALQTGPKQLDFNTQNTALDAETSQLNLLDDLSKSTKWGNRPGSRGQPGARGSSPMGEIHQTPSVPRPSVLGRNFGRNSTGGGSKPVVRGSVALPTLADAQMPMTVR